MSSGSAPEKQVNYEYLKALSKELRRPLETLYALSGANDPFRVDLPSEGRGTVVRGYLAASQHSSRRSSAAHPLTF